MERKNPSVKKYTFRRGNSKSRIDLILISEELSCHIINIKIIHCPFSDHDIKIMKLNVCDITRGSGTWIMNLHTIRSDYFRQVLSNWWVYWKLEKKSFSNLREWWDIAKIKIKSITIEASKKVNTTDDKIKALENRLETLKDISEPSRQQLEELADLENQIHSHYENKTDAARLRAKVDWYEKGEQSTKYFFNLERKNGQNKLWQKFRGLDGNLKYDIDEILDEQINFYANLFSTEGWDKNVAEELVTHMDKKLTCDESEDLEKDLTINEIKKIFFSMKQYKSPGLDGIINEFYQIYWDTIKEDLFEVLLEIFDKFEICDSQCR